MNKAKLTSYVSVLTLSFLILSGCKSDGAAVAEALPESGGPDTGGPDTGGAGTNSSPIIWGEPQLSTVVGATYLFQPEASDSDGDVLEFSIANKPGWADFDSATGILQGVADVDDVGASSNIVISVTDQTSIASLASFTITADAVFTPPDAPDGDTPSSPPVILGTPNKTAVVDSLYSFQPEASDEDGDELSFSIVNKPVWASFDTTTGLLEGRPTSADVGTTAAIELSVTDGTSIDALATFGITVEQAGPSSFAVSWTPPTQNEDGSALTDLAGYRIYYGTASGNYSEKIVLASPAMTTYVIENLADGQHYLVMTSINSAGMESKYTPELSFELGR
jgi:hypothetical protein